MTILTELDQLLRTNLRKFNVPGASLAVLRNGRIAATSFSGVLNLDTRVKTTVDSVFQIGSITKILTSTLIMQLVDEGRISLDAPVIEYLPSFRVERLDVSRAVTIRQFLSHTSGIDGDLFVESGRGEDTIARFMDKCTMVPSLFEPGEKMSYCNLGFAMLGRIIEVMRNKTYDEVLKDHLFEPLGMTHAISLPEDTLRFRCAIGHVPDVAKQNTWKVTRTPYLSYGQKAAGSTPAMSATDLLKFVRMHLAGGSSISGERILKSSAVRAMQSPQIRLQRHAPNGVRNWGLGWMLFDWHGQKLIGHDGATIGQFAYLRVFPAKKLAIALLTNGGDAKGLSRKIFDDVFRALARNTEPVLPAPARKQPGLASYAGSYSNIQTQINLEYRRNELFVTSIHKDSGQSLYPKNTKVTFIDKRTAKPVSGVEILDRGIFLFSEFEDSGKPRYLQTGFRQHRRVG